MRKRIGVILLFLFALLMVLTPCLAEKSELIYIEKDTLRSWLGEPLGVLRGYKDSYVGAQGQEYKSFFEAQQSFNRRPVIIDVRESTDWAGSQKKIKTAVRGDPSRVSEWGKTLGKALPINREVVLYCASPNEATSISVKQELERMGIFPVRVLRGGWKEWVKAGYPIEQKN
jgi:rhodanese-related sulfurtransferase